MGAYSYLHDKTYHAIKNIYPEMVIRENLHPDWLISKNGTRLEIDLYLESMNIAIEIQGIQHYEFTPRFHKTYQDFISQKDRDEQKRNLCYGNKVRLVEIASGIDLNIFIRELVSKSAQEKADEPKYFYQEKEKKVKEAGRSMLRFASVRRKIKRRQLIRMGLLPRPVIHEFGKLPGSQVQRCHAKKDLESYKTQEGNWIVWGGRNTHILTYNDNKLVCDCWHAQTVKTICSHIIKIMMDEGTFPSRESMLRTRQ